MHRHALGATAVDRDPLQRAWHALAHDGQVWLVDPLDREAELAEAQGLGEVVGVVQLLDRHNRDCAQVAGRLGVPLHVVPRTAPAGAPFEVVPVLRAPRWNEIALWWPEHEGLVVAEVVGTHPVWAAGPPEAGVHPFVRLRPPGGLERFDPEVLLVGHGRPLSGPGAAVALREGLARTRRDLPRVALALPAVLRSGRGL